MKRMIKLAGFSLSLALGLGQDYCSGSELDCRPLRCQGISSVLGIVSSGLSGLGLDAHVGHRVSTLSLFFRRTVDARTVTATRTA